MEGQLLTELRPIGGPNSLSAAVALPAGVGGGVADLRLLQDRYGTRQALLHRATVDVPAAGVHRGEGRRCLHLARGDVEIGPGSAGAERVPYRYAAAVVVTARTRTLVIRLDRADPIWTNLTAPPPVRGLCDARPTTP